MADQFEIPNRTPPTLTAPAIPEGLVNGYLERQSKMQQNMAALPANAINEYADWKSKQDQLKAGAFQAGGPALMNLLYGDGKQGGSQPTSNPSISQTPPAPAAPAASAASAPSIDPLSPGGTIHHSITQLGHPDHAGLMTSPTAGNPNMGEHAKKIQDIQAQMAQNAQMGAYGMNLNRGLSDQLAAERSLMEGEQFNVGQERTQANFNTSQASEEDRFQRAQNAKKNEATAGAVGKEGETVKNLTTIDSAIDELNGALSQNKPTPLSNIRGNLAEQFGTAKPYGIPIGSDTANNVNQAAAKLRAALSSEITQSGRYNAFTDQLLNVMVPTAKDQDYKAKIANIKTFRNAIATGSQQTVDNAVNSLLGGKISIGASHVGDQSSMVRIRDSSGKLHDIPSNSLAKARKIDPKLQVVNQ